jgi:parvulin-like peptidyl-prolyl isomerase
LGKIKDGLAPENFKKINDSNNVNMLNVKFSTHMKIKIRNQASFFALLAAALIALPCAQAAPPAAEATNSNPAEATGDPVMARGKGFEIRRSEMDQVLRSVTANNPEDRLPADAEIHAINQLIEIQLVLQKATAAEKAAGAKEAGLTFSNIVKLLTPEEFARRLQSAGMTADALRRQIANESTAQASLARQLGIDMTDAKVKQYYDDYPVASEQPAKVRVRELLLLTTLGYSSTLLPADVIQAKHRQIFDLYQRFRAGEDFTALAKQYNEDPESKNNGGELPPFNAEQMEFGDLAFSMKTNEVSDVLTNSDGYRFFQVLEKIPARKVPFAEMARPIKSALIGEAKRRLAPPYLKQLSKEAGVEILDARLKAMVAAAEPKPPPPGTGQP